MVDEIDEIRARLAAMSPNALSPEEQLAVRAAIAVFEAIDLEGTIATELTAAFRSLQSGVLRVLDDVAAALERLRQVFAELDPDRLVEPVTGSMARIRGELDRLDAPNLLAPARRGRPPQRLRRPPRPVNPVDSARRPLRCRRRRDRPA